MRGSLMVVCALLGVPWPGATAHGQAETVLRVSERLGAVPKWIDPDRTEIVAAPNGGYSVFDATRHSIVLFESDGHLARRFPVVAGRKPSQIRHGWYGELLWIGDAPARSLKLFDATSGQAVAGPQAPLAGAIQVVAITPDGGLVVLGRFPFGSASGRFGYALASGIGLGPSQVIVGQPIEECGVSLGGDLALIPWCQRVLVAVSPTGEWIASVHPMSGAAHRAGMIEAITVTIQGDTIGRVRMEGVFRNVPATVVADFLRRVAAEGRVSVLGTQLSEQAEYLVPAVTSIIPTRDQTLWLAQESPGASRYVVLSTSGHVVGRYTIAESLRLLAVGGRTGIGIRKRDGRAPEFVRVTF